MNNINMNLLKYFYYVAKYNSYTKAAEELLISQPSLSYSIKVLENQIDKQLFIRGKKLELTTYGKYLYDEVEKMMKIFDDMMNEDDIKGTVTIGIRLQYSNKILPKYISELSKIYPNLNIEYYEGRSNQLEKALKNNEIDLLIDEYEYDGIYESFIQLDDELVLISTKPNLTVDFNNNNYKIGIVKRNKITNEVYKKYPDIDFIEFQSTPMMLEYMNKNEDVLCINPRSVVNDLLLDNKLYEVKNNFDLPHAYMYITYNKKIKNKNILAVCDFFKEHSFYELNK